MDPETLTSNRIQLNNQRLQSMKKYDKHFYVVMLKSMKLKVKAKFRRFKSTDIIYDFGIRLYHEYTTSKRYNLANNPSILQLSERSPKERIPIGIGYCKRSAPKLWLEWNRMKDSNTV